MSEIAGHCGKCGAPYWIEGGGWWSIGPLPIVPTCNCWNLPKTITSTEIKIEPSFDGRDGRDTGDKV